MSTFALIVAMTVITFASRLSFMLRPVTSVKVKNSSFLDVFPVALFVVLAVVGLAAPDGELEVTPALMAGVGGVAGAFLFKRSLLAIVLAGAAAYWLARLLF
jgi:branched-subunit amino acid transport protein